jgi:hypothetical protein
MIETGEHMTRRIAILLGVVALMSTTVFATIFGSVRGIVHDPQHRPVQGAMVMLRATTSDWSKTTQTDAEGQFSLNAVPIGDYSVSVASPGFAQTERTVEVTSGSAPVVHFQLSVASAKETVDVAANLETVPTDSATPTTLVSRLDIERTPGASRSNSMAMITNYVPGAYVTHDQLHIRGGHQTSWLVDGVPVPNTNIASNIGPQFDPKDVDYLEVSRGSYGAELGDRTYGIFNIVPRSGFERNNQAELVLSAGNFNQTNDQFSFGSHTERFAYYGSVNGNRSDLGLQPPVAKPVHDAVNGYGGFGSLLFNLDPSDQLRLVMSARKDYYQIPYDPYPNDIENADIAANGFAAQYPSLGLRDGNHESDALVNFSWVHTFNSKVLLTVSPFYHRNTANYDGSPADVDLATTDQHTSTYAGGQVSFSANIAKNDLQAGFYGFHQNDSQFFGIIYNDGSGTSPLAESDPASGSLASFFVDDKFKPFSWLTLSAGIRPTHFSGGMSETYISPRFGAALHIPRLNWTFRGFYGHYYQAAPLLTVGGPLETSCNTTGSCGFLPLRGERDEEHQFGVTIPYRGWVLDADNFQTNAHNFFDHGCIGSGLCLPLTIERAKVRGWELTLRSPRIAHRGQVHLAYSNQVTQGAGAINGGFTDFTTNICDPNPGFCPLDHDQRNTLNLGGDVTLPWRSWASTNVYYGSGFSNAFPDQPYPGDNLPGHTTFDLSLGKDFGERFSASVNSLNVANRRVDLDNSQTFGGFHWNNPREIYVQLRYRFHY